MKLYECPTNTKVRLKTPEKGPPASITPQVGEVYRFSHCDGMYSLCYNDERHMVHLPAWSEVEIVK